ncbi:MAG TPA: diguanylate cyclase [Rhodocyclaceae bacterium]
MQKARSAQLDAIRVMDQAINAHTVWLGKFHRALVCMVEQEPANLAEDAHRRCVFGRWYYGIDAGEWERWSRELKTIGKLHRQMHDIARRVASGHAPVAAQEYDEFVATAIRFKNSLRALQFKIVNDVCLVDHLTGAWNRSALLQRVTEEYERRQREGGSSCLCMMDLDHFKAVNDQHGHAAGDEVLRAVVEIARRRLRNYDSIFRYGGEEFLICLPNIAMDEAATAMERVRQDVESSDIPVAGRTLRVTASFGVAQLCPELSIEESIEMADHALFCAKANGRNNVCRWDVACPAEGAAP